MRTGYFFYNITEFSTFSEDENTRNALAIVLDYIHEDDEGILIRYLDAVKLIEEDIPLDLFQPARDQSFKRPTVLGSIPLQQEPFGTGFIRTGAGTFKEDFEFKQMVYDSLDKVLGNGPNEGETIHAASLKCSFQNSPPMRSSVLSTDEEPKKPYKTRAQGQQQ